MANIETKWMKAEIKQEAKELRRLHVEVEAMVKKEKNEKASVTAKPGSTAGGL